MMFRMMLGCRGVISFPHQVELNNIDLNVIIVIYCGEVGLENYVFQM